MLVIADSNEEATNPDVIRELRKRFPALYISALTCGDLNVIFDNGSILAIERKNASDFLGSIADGRLFRQVENMAQNSKFYCVIVVGRLEFDENDMVCCNGEVTNWRGASVRGAMYALQWSGCPIIYATSQVGFPFAVGEAINFCSQPEQHLQRIGHHRVVTFPPVELSLEILSSFPGIGLKRAQALMDFVNTTKYGSLGGALAWASAFPLMKVGQRPEGWGNKSVESFRALLGLKPTQYLEIRDTAEEDTDENHSNKGRGQ